MRVLIVGGGIGGLAAAVALRRAGFEPAVFERATELREVGAGLTLWTNAVKVLRGLGLGPALEPIATPLAHSEIRTWDGRVLLTSDLAALGRKLGAPTVGVHRADLQRLLFTALEVGTVTLGAACVGFVQYGRGVSIRFADGREERGDLLIGADGLRSVVRGQLLGPEMPRYAGHTSWRGVGLIDRPDLPLGTTLLAAGRGSQVGYLPIGGGRTYWFATANVPRGGHEPTGTTRSNLLTHFADWYAPIPAVIAATDEAAICRTDIYDRPPIRRWGTGSVTLLGDAAHPTTPNLGQGACMAIEDAAVLAKCLAASGDDPVAGLRAYEAFRYERTAFVTNRSWQVGRMLTLEGRAACWVRDRALRLLRGRTERETEALVGVEV